MRGRLWRDAEGRPLPPGRLALRLISLLLLGPLALLVRAVRPWCQVRIGRYCANRIGHLAVDTAHYVERRCRAGRPPRTLDLLYPEHPPANRQLQRMLARRLPLLPRPLGASLDHVGALLIPTWENHRFKLWFQLGHRFASPQPELTFTPAEQRRATAELAAMGLDPAGPWACVHLRDPGYLHTLHPGHDWQYHNHRDGDPESYREALAWLLEQGLPVLRMGQVAPAEEPWMPPGVIPYATRYRTDFRDIVLLAGCHLFIGDTSGLSCVPEVFRRPMALVNVIPFGQANLKNVGWYGAPSRLIPKPLRAVESGRLVPFLTVMANGHGQLNRMEAYHAAGLEPLSNSAEEISELVREVTARIAGEWRDDPALQRLWREFAAAFQGLMGYDPPPVAESFLRRHPGLFQVTDGDGNGGGGRHG